jgi:spore coat polysaccharide biosynthesis predicted glycosyltransferase SpsG
MGHLFRALNVAGYLKREKERFIVIVNDDEKAATVLKEQGIDFITGNKDWGKGEWESEIIKKYNIHLWINDRLDTERMHSENVKNCNIPLVTFDDRGSGAELADINFGLMPCNYTNELKGKSIVRGLDYFIINKEVDKFKRKRTGIKKVLVTLGGSDTYGVSLKVAAVLKNSGLETTVITGPSFQHEKELLLITGATLRTKRAVPSLISEFAGYDIAITAGGITPFEANASGLPCMIIACEPHEIDNGRFLSDLGSSHYMGYQENIEIYGMRFDGIDVDRMSEAGMNNIHTNGVENIFNQIRTL